MSSGVETSLFIPSRRIARGSSTSLGMTMDDQQRYAAFFCLLASALFACSMIDAKVFSSVTASSARIFRSSPMPAAFNPSAKRLYVMPLRAPLHSTAESTAFGNFVSAFFDRDRPNICLSSSRLWRNGIVSTVVRDNPSLFLEPAAAVHDWPGHSLLLAFCYFAKLLRRISSQRAVLINMICATSRADTIQPCAIRSADNRSL